MESVLALKAEACHKSAEPSNDHAVPWSGLSADRSNWQEITAKNAAGCITDLSAMAAHIGKQYLDGEDLLAEVLERTMQLWAKGRGPTHNVNGYLVNSMRNRVIDEHRSPRSQVVGIPDRYEEHAVHGNPEAEFELRELRDAIDNALMQLPYASRALVIRVFVLNQKVGECAAITGMSANAVSLRLSRAKRTMRLLLESDPRVNERYAA
ncbi:RNA polymerase sigma factor [Leucobacter tenebrionis]|uniref:RNA polymerase sigma factor n=1 Tax=Leucobacter tenebrionis TaxID=2873270 RepID=UPI001CA6DF27|nr:sigma-70 family RNA polymerase sigma factor [Leucobacter tenebrionis]QZY52241.1 sigma-70 family RNA polymerase sigma factor [Leucobacter tenebrionis]